jgi:hypothetical protein
MKLALEIINREIAQRELANKHDHLRKEKCTKEIDELKQVVNLLSIQNVSGSFSDKDLLNGYCAGALETLTNKEDTFLGYDHLNKIKKEAEEWKERYTNDR